MVNFETISQKYSRTLNLFQRQTEGIVLLRDYWIKQTQNHSKSETRTLDVMVRLTDNNVLQRFFEGLGIVGHVEYDMVMNEWGYRIYVYSLIGDGIIHKENLFFSNSNPEVHDLMFEKMFEIAEKR